MYISKQEIIKEVKHWDLKSLSELAEELAILIKENSFAAEIILEYDTFKGSGDCTIDRVDKDTKKILERINPDKILVSSKYKGRKIWHLTDGYYQTCEVGNKAKDHKRYIRVNHGEIDSF